MKHSNLSSWLVRNRIRLLGAFLPFFTAAASDLTLQWDANPEPDVSGYRLRQSSLSGTVGSVQDVGLKTSYTVSNLTPGATYYFTVTAYDAEGFESDPSGELMFEMPLNPSFRATDNNAPQAVDVAVTGAEDRSVGLRLTATDADGDPITFVVKSLPKHGTLSGVAPNLTYTPAPNFSGPDSFTFSANDGSATSADAEVLIDVQGEDDAPLAASLTVDATEDQAAAIRLEATDPDGDPIQYKIVVPPAHGTLTGAAPELTYLPDPDYNGPDSFVYIADDGQIASSPATVSIHVTAVADRPIATPIALNTNEDSSASVLLRGVSPDGLPLTFTITSQPSRGTLTGKAPNLVYVPEANFFGADTFSFTVSDGRAVSEPSTVNLTVLPVNDLPVATSQSVTLIEDSKANIVLSAKDIDQDALTFQIVALPKRGTLLGTPPEVVYVPSADYNGTDSFTFIALDANGQSAPATVNLVVVPGNDAPSAIAQTVTVAEDSKVPVTLTGSDNEGSRLTYEIAEGPKNGTLVGTPPLVTYIPNKDFNGTDSFTFITHDGEFPSAPAAITVRVTEVNDAPIALNDAVTGPEDAPLSIELKATDVDGNPLTYKLVSAPTRGTLSGTPPNLIYTPAKDFNGVDALSFTVTDGQYTATPARVNITIVPQNDVPVALAQSLTVNEDTALSVTLGATDVDGDVPTYRIVAPPANGSVTGTPPLMRYTPNKDFNGVDSFSFVALDAQGDSVPAAVKIAVLAVNDRPIANVGSATVPEDGTIAISLKGSDVDGDPLTYSIASNPRNGTLSGNPPNLVYTPKSHFTGADSFTFTTYDGGLTSTAATFSITVNAVNDAPVANPGMFAVNEDSQVSFVLTGKDVENSPLTYKIVTGPSKGTLIGTAPNLTYKPAANYNGSDSISFVVSDGSLTSAPATIAFTVLAVNDAPTAIAKPVALNEDSSAAFTLAGQDIDGDKLAFNIVTRPTRGTLSGNVPNLIYTPAANFFGTDTLVFTVTDGKAISAPATINITVNPVNDVPVAISKNVTTAEDVKVAISLEGTDVENSKLTYTVVTKPTRGTLTGTAPYLTYVPNPNLNGLDSFTYTVSDGTAVSAPAKVNISVTAVNDAPVATAQTLSVVQGGKVSVVLSGTDAEGNSLRYTVVTRPTRGTLSGTAPYLTYTAASSFVGTDSFSFSVNDGSLTSPTAIVSIGVKASSTRSTPRLAAAPAEGDDLSSVVLVVPGGNATSFADGSSRVDAGTLEAAPTAGSFTLNADGSFEYHHNGGEASADAFSVTVPQGDGSAATRNFEVSVVRFSTVAAGAEEVVLQFSAVPAATYDVEASLDGAAWNSVTGPFVATARVMKVTDTRPSSTGYYRLVSQPDGIRVISPTVNVTLPEVNGLATDPLANPNAGPQIVNTADDF